MSDDEAIQRFVDGFNSGEVDDLIATATDDLVIRTAQEWPGGGEYLGADAARAFLEDFLGDWEEIRYERLAGEVVEGKVVERARWVGTGRTSGLKSTVDFYTSWTIRDGLVARMDIFAKREQAREFARTDSRPS